MTYPLSKVEKLTAVDHKYFNLTYFNNVKPTDSTQFVPAQVIQTYDRPIVDIPEDWNLSIARFSISSDYIGRVYQTLGTTAGNTSFFVGLSYSGTFYDEPIVLPTVLSPNGQNIQVAYDVNSFLNIINAGYALAQTSVAGAGGPTGTYGQVLMTYEPQNGLYTLNVPAYYGTGTVGLTAGNGIGVHMSYPLYHLFLSFNTIVNVPLLWNNHDVTFVRYWSGNNLVNIVYPPNNSGTGPSGGYMALAQDAPWASSIMTPTRLIITTTSIPITQEYRAQQLYSSFGGNPGNQALSIITDFFIGEDSSIQNSNESFLYTPNLLRLSSLQGTNPIRQLDLQVYFAIADGTIFPLFLSPGDSIDVKLLFLKKGLTS
jgi:hypothetical protein